MAAPPSRPPIAHRLAGTLLRVAPASARQRLLQLRRVQKRRRRLRAEARGDQTYSTPALHGMDLQLAEIIGPGGVFVEAGANDGIVQSNTYYLERFHGWTGLLVEAIPSLAREVRINRPNATVVQTALVETDDAGPIEMVYGDLMSVVAGARGSAEDDEAWAAQVQAAGLETVHRVTVPTRSLSSVLDDVGITEIDLLSLDVEGFEPVVLAGLDLQRHAPRWALVEVRDRDAVEPVAAVLGESYVVDRWLSPFDVLFRRSDVPPSTA